MRYNLFLDDFRHPYDCVVYMTNTGIYSKWSWVVAKNYDEFVSIITEKGMPDFISFDHDLADEHYAPEEIWNDPEAVQKRMENFKEKTGLECAKWLCDYCIDYRETLPPFEVHSMNPVGAENIKGYLESFKKFQSEY